MASGNDRQARMKILGLLGDPNRVTAVDAYRITMPFTALNNNGYQCAWMPVMTAQEELQRGNADAVFGYDIVVLGRLLTYPEIDMGPLVQALRFQGAKVVYETDDDYTGRYRPADVLNVSCLPFVPHVDALTVTTKPLAELMREVSGGQPVHIVPNAIDYKWFGTVSQSTERQDDRLTVMLAGTQTHYMDWKVMAEVLPVLHERYPGVRFVAAGFRPAYLEDVVEFIDPVPYPKYPCVLRQADILCAPLVPDDKFNHSKSAIKALEGWSAARPVRSRLGGCAVVATNCVTYRGTVQNRHNGLLVEHTPEAWIEALDTLIGDGILRAELQIEGYKDAKRHDVATQWRNWARAYNAVRRLP